MNKQFKKLSYNNGRLFIGQYIPNNDQILRGGWKIKNCTMISKRLLTTWNQFTTT